MPEAPSLVRALDEPGDVGHDEPFGVLARDAEVRREGGEGIVGDLRLGGREPRRAASTCRRSGGPPARRRRRCGARRSRRFSSPCLARLGRARHAVARGGERDVPPTAAAAPRDDRPRALAHEVGERARSRRRPTVPSGTGITRSLPFAPSRLRRAARDRPALALRCGWSASHGEVVDAAGHLEHDRAALAAVPAVGAAAGLVRLACRMRGPVAAPACLCVHGALVDERHRPPSLWWSPAPRREKMTPMPEPTTVWMVHLRRGEAVGRDQGRARPDRRRHCLHAAREARRARILLVLERPTGQTAPWLTGDAARMADRRRGPQDRLLLRAAARRSPRRSPDRPACPAIPFTTRPTGAFGAIRRSSKRRHQKTNIQYLQTVGIRQKDEIEAWVDAIMERRIAP